MFAAPAIFFQMGNAGGYAGSNFAVIGFAQLILVTAVVFLGLRMLGLRFRAIGLKSLRGVCRIVSYDRPSDCPDHCTCVVEYGSGSGDPPDVRLNRRESVFFWGRQSGPRGNFLAGFSSFG